MISPKRKNPKLWRYSEYFGGIVMDVKPENLPQHIGIIMDGNGRWAKKRGLNRWEGHTEGAKTFRRIGEYASDLGIKYMTFYAFSTENWNRLPEEVASIMALFREYLLEAEERIDENKEKQLCLKFIGTKDRLPDDIVDLMERSEKETEKFDRFFINIALNYGGRAEITEVARKIAEQAKSGELDPKDISEQTLSNLMYTAGQPDPDLIIRPSGEYRISNFLLWQSAYTEYVFTDVLWPDFTNDDLDRCIEMYVSRARRFGK